MEAFVSNAGSFGQGLPATIAQDFESIGADALSVPEELVLERLKELTKKEAERRRRLESATMRGVAAP